VAAREKEMTLVCSCKSTVFGISPGGAKDIFEKTTGYHNQGQPILKGTGWAPAFARSLLKRMWQDLVESEMGKGILFTPFTIKKA